MIKPEGQQIEALNRIIKWYNSTQQVFTLGGYAGSGKTSLIPIIQEELSWNYAVVTYTNKAASILRSKGIAGATTIFRLMYKLIDEQHMIWHKNDKLEVDLIIVDEASMLGQNIRDDLESYGIPVLYIGDPFQLPPVKEESVMDHCDFILTEVRRHGGEILEIATAIREGRKYPDVDQFSISDADLSAADIVICLSNDRRNQLNQRIRKHRGFIGLPQKGDRVMSAKTDYDCGIFAGELGTLIGTNNRRRYEVLFDGWDDTVVFTNGHFLSPKENPYSLDLKGRGCLDYGYVSTCHKCQGSQFDNVIVWEESRSDARWMYTAVTRAILTVTIGGK
jgi:exodeoxyribonuclease-5